MMSCYYTQTVWKAIGLDEISPVVIIFNWCLSDIFQNQERLKIHSLTLEICGTKHFCESIVISLQNYRIQSVPLRVMSFYRSQKCGISKFSNNIENFIILKGQSPCIAIGDSNIAFLENISDDFSNLLWNSDFKNCHTLLTRPSSGKSIDNVFSNLSNIFSID